VERDHRDTLHSRVNDNQAVPVLCLRPRGPRNATDEAERSADLDRHDETCREAEQLGTAEQTQSVSIDASPTR
jgi:hypothetical protein